MVGCFFDTKEHLFCFLFFFYRSPFLLFIRGGDRMGTLRYAKALIGMGSSPHRDTSFMRRWEHGLRFGEGEKENRSDEGEGERHVCMSCTKRAEWNGQMEWGGEHGLGRNKETGQERAKQTKGGK